MKKLLLILLACAMIFAFVAACNGDDTPDTPPAVDPPPVDDPAVDPPPVDDDPVDDAPPPVDGADEVSNFDLGLIGYSSFTMDIPFPLAVTEGVQRAEAYFGANISTVDNGNDVATNVSQIEDLMAAGISALVLNPVDVNAVTPVIEDAIAQGIFIVSVNRLVADIPLDGVTHVWLGTDNVEAGYAKGEFFLTQVEEGADVIILEGTPGASSGIDRLDGFTAATEGRLNVLESITANFNRVDGLHVTEDLLVRFPDVRYIIAMNDEMGLGAIQAALDAGRVPGEDIFITGFDGGDDARDAVAAGEMMFTVYQDPEGMGFMGIEVALGLMRGETFPPRITFDVGFVTR